MAGSLLFSPNSSYVWDGERELDLAACLVLLWSSLLVDNRSALNIGVGVTVSHIER
ncbi:hypothetical protein KSD_95870 [Ktedonobacter sp. SOSP1-85]|nr:hypothetical protein KSD_95870 [Ktedonobacter sp. SOSP1-85]